MAKVFVSYSRKDITFAKRLAAELQKCELDFWIDWEGIPPTVDWWKEIEKGIEEADIFLFLISPDSAKSKVCGQEIDTAVKNGKRIIPIVVREIEWEDTPPQLGHLNYIFFSRDDDFDTAVNKLITAIQTDYEWAATQRRLQVKALDWERNHKDSGFLLRGLDLLDAEQDLAVNTSKDPHPTDLQREYIFASRKDATRRQRQTLAGVIIALVISIVLAVLAVFQKQEAVKQANISRAGELAALAILEKDKHFDRSLLFAIESLDTYESPRTRGTLFTVSDSHPQLKNYLFGHTTAISSLAFSPDGLQLASGSYDHSLILWDIARPGAPTILSTVKHSTPVTSVAFSPNGKQLASGSMDHSIILWDVSNAAAPVQLATLLEHMNFIAGLAFSQDGQRLMSGDEGHVIVWDIRNPKKPLKIGDLPGSLYAFSPDGNQIALGDDELNINIWDASNPGQPSKLVSIPPQSFSPTVAFRLDGKQLVTGGNKATLALWDISNPENPAEFPTFPVDYSNYTSAVFSPDGKHLASIDVDTTIIIWDISDPANPWRLTSLVGHAALPGPLVFSPDGNYLASGSGDGTIILWNNSDWEAPTHLTTFARDESFVTSLAFSPDGKKVAAANGLASILLWDILDSSSPTQIGTLQTEGNVVYSLAFSPDSNRLLSADDKNLMFWDVSHPSAPARILTSPLAHEYYVSGAFSADGTRLALGSLEIPAALWDITDPAAPSQLTTLPETSNTSGPLAFRPDSKWLASVSVDDALHHSIILWDVSDPAAPRQLATLSGHNDEISSLAFSPDGKILASGSWDNSMILWDISDLTAPLQLAMLSGPAHRPPQAPPPFRSIAFSPDSTRLSTAGFYGITLWDLDIESLVKKACQRAGRNFTRAEWAQYFPGKSYPSDPLEATCPQWPLDPATTSLPTP